MFVTAQSATLWVGDRLGRLERACLCSVLRQGHGLHLYCYRPPDGVPEGVELRDAAEIVPEERIVRHRSGSVSLFSNLFRYELQRRGLGTWLDCDAYLLKPLDGDAPYLLGEEAPGTINGGVLRLPPDSPMLPPLIGVFGERKVPPWLPLRAQAAAHWRLLATGRTGLARMPWGSAGPKALTAVARAQGLLHHALPADVLYPVPWQDAAWICDPRVAVEQVTTPRTVSVHLWNDRIKGFKHEPASPGSFLARLQQEGA